MVFSFFRKPDSKEPAKPARPEPRVRVPAVSPAQNPAPPSSVDASKPAPAEGQVLTRRIDQIEAEMKAALEAKPAAPPAPVAPLAFTTDGPPLAPVIEAPELGAETDNADLTGSFFGGANPLGLADLVVEESSLDPALEEIAVLFNTGQTAAAIAAAEATARQGGVADATQLAAWQMLFELLRLSGQRERHEALALEFARRFETSPPVWYEAGDTGSVSSARRAAVPEVRLGMALEASDAEACERLVSHAGSRPSSVVLDASSLKRVDADGCAQLLAALQAVRKLGVPVRLEGGEVLVAALREWVEPGRRDDKDAPWRLLIETYRLLGRQADFEDTCVDYAVTYEISPPSWEPPLAPAPNLGKSAPAVAVAPSLPAPDPDAFLLSGVLEGDIEELVAILLKHAERHARVELDCRRLERIDFTAGAQLLSGMMSLLTQGKTFRFTHTGPLQAPMLVLLGMGEVASIERRRF